MIEAVNGPEMDWCAIFDELKKKETIINDAKLAASLGVTRSYICSVRKGRKGLSFTLAQDIFTRLGRSFDTEQLERLFIPVKVQSHLRNQAAIRNYVIQRANGYCQLCGLAAPFKDTIGIPFLEVHHVIPLKNFGIDSPDNLVALCPNCHRKIGVNASDIDREKLQSVVSKYQKSE